MRRLDGKTAFSERAVHTFDEMVAAWKARFIFLARSRRFLDTECRLIRHGKGMIKPLMIEMFEDDPNAHTFATTFLHDRLFTTVDFEDYFPGQPRIVTNDEGTFANMWMGWDEKDGDLEPFMEFTNLLFRRSKMESERLLDIISWRVQHPCDHVPFAAILSGPEPDNAIWIRAIEAAFYPYCVRLSASHIRNPTRVWMRDISLAAMTGGDETIQQFAVRDALTSMIASPTDTRTLQYLQSNQRAFRNQYFCLISSGKAGDAHFPVGQTYYVVSTEKVPDEVYDRLNKFLNAGNGKRIMNFLLKRDLSNFRMPVEAPKTAASEILKAETMLPFERLAEEMLTSKINRVAMWVSESLDWANSILEKSASGKNVSQADVQRAEMIMASLPEVTIRPWYTAEEISLLFPSVQTYRVEKHLRPSCISKELRSGGLPYLIPTDNPKGFMRGGIHRHYFIVSDHEKWMDPISQEEFDREWKSFPTYRQYAEQVNSGKTG